MGRERLQKKECRITHRLWRVLGGQAGAKVGGSIFRSEAAGNAVTAVTAVTAALGNAVVNQVPGVVDATSNAVQETGRAIGNTVNQATEKINEVLRGPVDLDDG